MVDPAQEEHSWKVASTWVATRDATQIRTHVQKYKKDKLSPWLKNLTELKEEIELESQQHIDESPSSQDSDDDDEDSGLLICSKKKEFLSTRILEYLQVLSYSKQ